MEDPVSEDGRMSPMRQWALVKDGIVAEVRKAAYHLAHPFSMEEVDGGHVLDVTGVPCHPGFMADAKGNVTPAEGRTAPIPDGLPAYHAGPGVTHLPINVSAEMAGGEGVVDETNGPDAGTGTVVPQNPHIDMHPELPKHAMASEEADEPVAVETPADEAPAEEHHD